MNMIKYLIKAVPHAVLIGPLFCIDWVVGHMIDILECLREHNQLFAEWIDGYLPDLPKRPRRKHGDEWIDEYH